jgi:hypothetical protein
MAFPHRKIAARLAQGDATQVTKEIGAALEDVVAWTLCSLPGVRVLKRDFLDRAGSAEYDLFLFNNRRISPIEFLPENLLVECKNWAVPVGSATVRDFIGKLLTIHQRVGILVAANGITGDLADQTAANDVIRQFFDSQDIKVIVLKRSEIEAFRSKEDIVFLLEERYGEACVRSTVIAH